MIWGKFRDNGWAHICLIALLGAIVYANSLHVPFYFDDSENIINNPAMRDSKFFLDPSAFRNMEAGFTLKKQFSSRYFSYLTFALDYRIHGLDLAGYHIVNTAIHITCGVFIYLTILRLFATPYAKKLGMSWLLALSVSLLFVTHPVHTQAVLYISQRFASLAACLSFGSMYFYFKFRTTERGYGVYWLAILFSALSMMTKETAFTVPVMIAAAEFMFFEGPIKRRLIYLAPLIASMLIVPYSLSGSLNGVQSVFRNIEIAPISVQTYFLTELRVILTYLRLLIFPFNMTYDYDYPTYFSALEGPVILSALLLAALVIMGGLLYRRSRFVAFGVLWFFVTSSIESSIIPQGTLILEHRLYMPSFGLLFALVIVLWPLVKRSHVKVAGGIMVVLILLLAVTSIGRNSVWIDNETFYRDILDKAPKRDTGYSLLATVYMQKGRNTEALELLTVASRLNPISSFPYNDMGVIYLNTDRYILAVENFRKALQLAPMNISARANLGAAYLYLKRPEDAIVELNEVLKLNPYYMDAYLNLGVAYNMLDRQGEVIKTLERALTIDPSNVDVRSRLETVKRNNGKR